MTSAGRSAPPPSASATLRAWQGFRRARTALWALMLIVAIAGAGLHDWTSSSVWARILWLAAAAVAISYPLRRLLGFRCPRCQGLFFATGDLRDFLGVHRLLWGRRCCSCSLRAGRADLGPDVPDSRPGAAF